MSIFRKLFLLLAALAALPLLLAAMALMRQTGSLQSRLLEATSQAGSRGAMESHDALYLQASRAHRQVVSEKTAQLDAFFGDIRRAVHLQASLAAASLAAEPGRPLAPLYRANDVAEWFADPRHPFTRLEHGRLPYAIFHAAPGVVMGRAALALNRLRALGPLFAHNHRELPGCMTSYVGHRDGFIFGYPGKSPFKPEYDPRLRPWYKEAVKAGRQVWTGPYLDKNGRDLVVTCSEPVRLGRDAVAVAAVDVKLTDILGKLFDLRQMRVSNAVLMDQNGWVQVSAAYENARARLKPGSPLKPEHVSSFAGGLFAPAFWATASGEAALVEPRSPDPRAPLIAYGAVTLEEPGPGFAGRRWYYVVATPLGEIVGPAREIRSMLERTQEGLQRGISSRVRALWLWIAAMAAGALLLALACAYAAARAVVRPLVSMSEAAQRIGRGDLEVRVSAGSRDELGRMGEAINEMVKGLRERDLVKSTFKRYVAASVVDQLLSEPERLRLGGEKKDLTVFFSDLEGFTSLAESLSPEDLVAVINEYLGAMTDAIFAHEGTLDKYEGDAIMAFWGAPLHQGDHALKACRAALDNLAALRRLWPLWERRGLPRIDLRIGLNTGPMVVGNMGSPARMEYTVMGDSVNLGARLEAANKIYGTRILMSESTRAAAGPAIAAREIDFLTVKGKSRPVRVYELLGLQGEVSTDRLNGCRAFEAGLRAYRARDWDRAEAFFHSAIQILDDDPPSRFFLGRVAALRAGGLPEDWDGSFKMTSK